MAREGGTVVEILRRKEQESNQIEVLSFSGTLGWVDQIGFSTWKTEKVMDKSIQAMHISGGTVLVRSFITKQLTKLDIQQLESQMYQVSTDRLWVLKLCTSPDELAAMFDFFIEGVSLSSKTRLVMQRDCRVQIHKDTPVRGYKILNKNLKSNYNPQFQYEMNKLYQEKIKLSVGKKGFHSCVELAHCLFFYSLTGGNRIFETRSHGRIIRQGVHICSEWISLYRELTLSEARKLCTGTFKIPPGDSRFPEQISMKDGLLHRTDGPAYIEKRLEFSRHIYYQYGRKTREDGPADTIKLHGTNGSSLKKEKWYDKNGLKHRDGGPSIATLFYHEYYSHGEQLKVEVLHEVLHEVIETDKIRHRAGKFYDTNKMCHIVNSKGQHCFVPKKIRSQIQ